MATWSTIGTVRAAKTLIRCGRRVTEDKAPYGTDILGRAKRMIHWLTENQQRVNELQKGEVRFCFAGNSLAIHVTEVNNTVS